MKNKKYLKALELIEKNKRYSKEEAVKKIKEISYTKFDGTVEIALKLNVDPKKSDQQIRGAIVLPNGTGKEKKVLVIAKGEKAKEAKEANADFVGDSDLIEKIEKENWLEFDVIVTTPDMMPLLGKLGKVLGPKGLMPNPKSGTVTKDVSKAVTESKAGKIEYRVDESGIVHAPIGKVSFGAEKVTQNAQAILSSIKSNKPSSIKSAFVSSIYITTSMGPSVPVTTSAV